MASTESTSAWGALGRFFRGLWRGLDGLRKVLHLLFLFFFAILLLALLLPEPVQVPASAALRIAPQGDLVEQLTGDPVQRALARAQGLPFRETLLKDQIDAIRAARDDRRIQALVLQLDGLAGAGLSKLQELAAEVVAFKESGKPVIALGDGYTRNQYFLASMADEIYLHPMGGVLVDGYSRYQPYYRSLLEKLYVDYNVWTVGEYKSFVEPVTRDDMSPEDREATREYLDAIWVAYQSDVAAARGLSGDALQRYADEAVALLERARGHPAQMALDYGLVDQILSREQMRLRVRELVGENSNGEGFAHVDVDTYLSDVRPDRPALRGGQRAKIAVIVASGDILDGAQPPGSVGGDSTAELIRRAEEDDDVRALVLRVDSPGGSAFASEVILQQLETFQESGRPVVVSMGSVAASGGYWISMSADEIWASPTTLTGSIGVGAMLPTFQRSLEQIGVRVDGLGTTELAGLLDPTRELGENVYRLVALEAQHVYEQFVGKIAERRGRAAEEIERVARGRVWVGARAKELGLVDELGDFEDAVRSAAALAGLEEGQYRLEYLERQPGFAERVAMMMARQSGPVIRALGVESGWPRELAQMLEAMSEPVAFLRRLNDPRGVYAYCFCDVR